jgi:hypothetical protein
MTTPGVSWRAGRNQIAHAWHQTGRRDPLRAMCGQPLTPLRLAWPAVVKCPDCLVATGQRGVPA